MCLGVLRAEFFQASTYELTSVPAIKIKMQN